MACQLSATDLRQNCALWFITWGAFGPETQQAVIAHPMQTEPHHYQSVRATAEYS